MTQEEFDEKKTNGEAITAFQFLCFLHEKWCHFQTREGAKRGVATRNELRRWFLNQAVVINGRRVKAQDIIEFPIEEMYLFPKKKVTLWKL